MEAVQKYCSHLQQNVDVDVKIVAFKITIRMYNLIYKLLADEPDAVCPLSHLNVV